MDIASLALKVDSSGVVQGVKHLDDLDRASGKAEQSTNRLSSAYSTLRNAIVAVGIGAVAKQFIETADKASLMDARLKLATRSTEEFAEARRSVIALADANRSDLEATATLYTKLSGPVQRLGGGVHETTAIVDAFSKTLLISGASTQEANAAIQQFGQAMASGKLQGDEFRSMAEASPRFMKAIADGAGIPIERLKEMSSEGKLAADVVGNALTKELEKLRKEAESLPRTSSQAIQQLKNDVMLAVNEINNSGSISNGIVGIIDGVRELIPAIKTELVEMAAEANAWFERNTEQLGAAWEMAKGLGRDIWELVEGAASVVGFIAEWVVQSGAARIAIESVRLLVAGLQDGVEIIGALFAKVGAVIIDVVTGALRPFVLGLADIADFMGLDIAAPIRAAGEAMGELSTSSHKYADEVFAKFARGDTAVGRFTASLAEMPPVVTEVSVAVEKTDAPLKKLVSNLASEDDKKGAAAAARKAKQEFEAFKDAVTGLVHELDPYQKRLDDYVKKTDLLNKALKAGLITESEYEDLLIRLTDNTDEYNQKLEAYNQAMGALIAPTDTRLAQLKQEMELYGKTEAQLARLTLAELENARAMALKNGALPNHVEFYETLIRKQRELAGLLESKDARDVQVSFWLDLESVAHETFLSIADSNKDFWERMKDAAKNTFFEWLYQMIAKPFFVQIVGQFSNGGVAGMVQNQLAGGAGGGGGGNSFFNPTSIFGQFGSYMATGFMNTIAGTGASAGFSSGMSMIGNGYYAQGAGMMAGSVLGPAAAGYGFAQQYGVAGGLVGGAGTVALAGGAAGLASGAGFMAGASGALAGLGPVGWAALAIGAILGAMNQPEEPSARLLNSASGNPDDFEDNVMVTTPFGSLGLHDSDTREVSGKAMKPLLEWIAALDVGMVQGLGLTSAKVKEISETLNDTDFARNNVEDAMRDAIKERTALIFEGAGMDAFAAKARALTGELGDVAPKIQDLVEGAIVFKNLGEHIEGLTEDISIAFAELAGGSDALLQGLMPAVTTLLDPENDPFKIVEEQQKLAARSLTEVWQQQNNELDTFMQSMDFSAESMAKLGGMAKERYATELMLVQQIADATRMIGDLTANNIETIRMSQMSDEQKYEYMRAKVDRDFAMLDTLTDPTQIAQLVSGMNTDIMSAFGLLSPEEQARLQDDYIARLEQLDEKANEQLAEAAEAIKAERAELSETLTTAIKDGMKDAVEKSLEAANTSLQAALIQKQAADTAARTFNDTELSGSWNMG